MRQVQNFYKSTITQDWTIGLGNFYVSLKPTITEGWLVVSPNNATLREVIYYNGVGTDGNGDYITITIRGVGTTDEQTHSIGEPIRMNVDENYWKYLTDAIDAIVVSGAPNADTVTRGIVEEATAAEIDAGTQAGSTTAELFVNPKYLNDCHNIPTVAPGTSGNAMVSNGTDWISGSISPIFQQTLTTKYWNTEVAQSYWASGSTQDGSAIFTLQLYGAAGGQFNRFERDSKTGLYLRTHTGDPGLTSSTGDVGAIINIGNYIYYFSNDGTNITCKRYLASDLSGGQAMTVPTVANTTFVTVWTDGTYAYVVSAQSDTTSRKWSLSGTTFSAVDTQTITTGIFAKASSTTTYDGTSAYYSYITNTAQAETVTILKLTNIYGTTYTTTVKNVPVYSEDAIFGNVMASISSDKMYIGYEYKITNETSTQLANIMLLPITKP